MNSSKLYLCKLSESVLNIGLFIITCVFAYIAFYLKTAYDKPEQMIYITNQCKSMLEYAMLSLAILVCGALLIDYEYKKGRREI